MKYSLIAFCLLAFTVNAQLSDEQYLIQYKEAVQTYANHDFNEAIIQLAPLTKPEYNNGIVPYAMFYYGLSAFESEKFFQSREMIRKLIARFPDWDKIDEAYYLYANANLSENYFEEGLTFIDKIRDPEIQNSSENLLAKYIPDIQSVNQLKLLYQKFPNQREVAKTLVKRIQDRPYNSREDLELSDILTNRFKLKDVVSAQKSDSKSTNYARAFDDQSMDFGILLPFDLSNASNVREISNQYVYDMYAGMLIAEKELQDEGVPLRLFGIDVGMDPLDIKEHLEDINFRKIDLLFGPLYPKPNRVTSNYAEKNQIIQVHPLSNNESLIKDQPYVFLLQPSYTTQCEKTLNFCNDQNWNKTCAIYFDQGRKDSLFAYTYKKKAEQMGWKVLEIKKITPESKMNEGIQPGHIFITGEDTFGPLIQRTMGMSKIKAPVLATAYSYDFQRISRNVLDNNLYFIYPEFVDVNKTEVSDFKRAYIAQMNTIPSYFSYLGYDMIKFYSLMLKDGKEIFRLNLNESPNIDQFTLSGFDYSQNKNENRRVPIVKWKNGIFEAVNNE